MRMISACVFKEGCRLVIPDQTRTRIPRLLSRRCSLVAYQEVDRATSRRQIPFNQDSTNSGRETIRKA
jgi:hypothetical protein